MVAAVSVVAVAVVAVGHRNRGASRSITVSTLGNASLVVPVVVVVDVVLFAIVVIVVAAALARRIHAQCAGVDDGGTRAWCCGGA